MEWLNTLTEWLWRAWAYVSTGRTWAGIAGIGFACLAIVLLFAMRTRWGRSKPLTKCIVLSLLAHVWLLMYVVGHRPVLPQGDRNGIEDGLSIAFEPFEEAESLSIPDSIPTDESPALRLPESSGDVVAEPEIIRSPESLEEFLAAAGLPKLELLDRPVVPSDEPSPSDTRVAPIDDAVVPPTMEEPAEQGAMTDISDAVLPSEAILPPIQPPPMASESVADVPPEDAPGRLAATSSRSNSPGLPSNSPIAPSIPEEYRLRQMSNRLEIARAFGADEDSEAAVEAALQWLARAQSPDGSWNAAKYGAGTETRALGEYRYGTGDRADTGVTGLALLAFLSAGHTHLEGHHRDVVTRGLRYLLQVQMPSGDLSGPKMIGNDNAVVNARMYCHSIALLALAEAHAMTQDRVLRDALLKSAQYTINAQDPRGGGWRYNPGEPGDLSLFGWKAMALTSVARSGIQVPEVVQQRAKYFLASCTTSRGGLARYRPREGAPSATMTAESLACHLLLRQPLSADARSEATEMIMANIPGSQPDNVYYWYYATLALFQLQDENWRQWNGALKTRLLETQKPAYDAEGGSWAPDSTWGGYGGRVYSTAMSCLCLEVYYRYLPLYR